MHRSQLGLTIFTYLHSCVILMLERQKSQHFRNNKSIRGGWCRKKRDDAPYHNMIPLSGVSPNIDQQVPVWTKYLRGSNANAVHLLLHTKNLHVSVASVIFCHIHTQSNTVIKNDIFFNFVMSLDYICTCHLGEREMARRWEPEPIGVAHVWVWYMLG